MVSGNTVVCSYEMSYVVFSFSDMLHILFWSWDLQIFSPRREKEPAEDIILEMLVYTAERIPERESCIPHCIAGVRQQIMSLIRIVSLQ
jgi:hypothetical protein